MLSPPAGPRSMLPVSRMPGKPTTANGRPMSSRWPKVPTSILGGSLPRGPMRPSSPSRAHSRMWRRSRARPRPGARTWFSSSASCSMPSVMMAGCGSTRRRWCVCAPREKRSRRTSTGVVCHPRTRATARVGQVPPVRHRGPAEPSRQRDAAHGPPRDARNLRKPGRVAASRLPAPTRFSRFPSAPPRCGRLSFGGPGGAHPADRPPAQPSERLLAHDHVPRRSALRP